MNIQETGGPLEKFQIDKIIEILLILHVITFKNEFMKKLWVKNYHCHIYTVVISKSRY